MNILSKRNLVTIIEYAAIVLWLLFWFESFRESRLQFGGASWLPAWDWLGIDYLHSHLAVQAWLHGLDPYSYYFGDDRGLYAYPPPMLPLFAWAGLVPDFSSASIIWAMVIAGGVLACVWQIHDFRRAQAWSPLSPLLMLGLVLWSSPVVFAMERGNSDVLILGCLLVAAPLLAQSARMPLAVPAAALLALAAAIKIYPLAVLAALAALRRYLVLALTILFLVLVVLLLREEYLQWLNVIRTLPIAGPRVNPILDFWLWLRGNADALRLTETGDLLAYLDGTRDWGARHSPGDWWWRFWLWAGVIAPASWPVALVHVVTLTPVTAWGFWRIFTSKEAARMPLPILLWAATVGTYWMPYSYDYNLIFLPLLFVALWDTREPWWMQALVLLSAVWWVPFGPTDIEWTIARVVVKLLSLYIVTLLLVRSFNRHRVADSSHSGPLNIAR